MNVENRKTKVIYFLKKNINIVIAFIIGMILSGSIVYATVYFASDIKYIREESIINVAEALNELYASKKETSDEVKDISTNGLTVLDKYYKKLNINISNQLDGIILNKNNNYTTTGAHSRVYVIVSRANGSNGATRPEFKRNNVSIAASYTTNKSDANTYNTNIYIVDNVEQGEEWSFLGLSYFLYFN